MLPARWMSDLKQSVDDAMILSRSDTRGRGEIEVVVVRDGMYMER